MAKIRRSTLHGTTQRARRLEVNPGSFTDLAAVMQQLAGKSKSDLLAVVHLMIIHSPENLSVLGIEGFEDEDEDFDDEVWD